MKKNISDLVNFLIVMLRKFNVAVEDNDYDSMRILSCNIDGFCFALDCLSIHYFFKRSSENPDIIVSVSVDGKLYDVD